MTFEVKINFMTKNVSLLFYHPYKFFSEDQNLKQRYLRKS